MAKNLTVSLPQQYADRLATEARITGLNASEIIRRALDDLLMDVLLESEGIYVHCSRVKAIRGRDNRRTLSGFDNWDDALDYVKCNLQL